jgi:aminopeptidase N
MKTFFYHIVLLVILITLFPISLLHSQNIPGYKNRISVNKQALFPISDNQKSFDIKSYDLKFDFNFSDSSFSGESVVTLQSIVSALSQVHLDLGSKSIFGRTANRVDSIFITGKPVTYTHNDTTLLINLDRKYGFNEQLSIKIYYRCKIDNFYLMLSNKNNRNLIFNISEPFGARFWFPCKDYPEDKADSVRVTVTVPSSYSAASNGRLEKVSESNGKKTFYWIEKYPIATYLISLAIYPYIVYQDYYRYTQNDSMQIINYVIPEDTASFGQIRNIITKILGFYEGLYGEYPFRTEKYGNAQVDFSGGMENQTITSLGLWNDYVLAHEMAHSWFGDAVTCKDFHNIWLNEGFATYSTAVYMEKTKSKNDFLAEMTARKYFGNGTIYRDDLNDDMSIFFEGLVYSKAAWVLHMLRYVIGETSFFSMMKNYYNANKYSTADENTFKTECEKAYGNSLSWFFNEWIHQEYYPTYKYSWQQIKLGANYQVSLSVEQTPPATYIYKMPVDITFKTGTWDTTIVVWDSLQTQKFSFILSKSIDSVFLDRNDHILKKTINNTTGIEKVESENHYILLQNYPNPFNSSSVIRYSLEKAGIVTIKLYDLLGREVQTLLKSFQQEGSHQFVINADKLSSGIYFYSIGVNGYKDIKKMVLIR